MITKTEFLKARARAAEILTRAGIVLTDREKKKIEVADLGLGDLENIGLEIAVYINTKRCCAKELVLFPGQICPEHSHPDIRGKPGKEETFRCRKGIIYLYVPGRITKNPKAKVPKKYKKYLTVWHEIILKPGQQRTIPPNTRHWFQSGPAGAIVSEFSTASHDKKDIFTDPHIKRTTKTRK